MFDAYQFFCLCARITRSSELSLLTFINFPLPIFYFIFFPVTILLELANPKASLLQIPNVQVLLPPITHKLSLKHKTHKPTMHHNPPPPLTTNNAAPSSKAAMWQDDGMDELLAVLGYKVKSSRMADVVEKMEQLDKFMGAAQEDGCSQLASDTVHYNPSDLSNWLESMISEIPPNFDPVMAAPPPPPPPLNLIAAAPPPPPVLVFDDNSQFPESSTITSIDFSDQNNSKSLSLIEDCSSSNYELTAIPGTAIFSNHHQTQFDSSPREPKRLKTSPDLYAAARSVVVVDDSQENGVRLVHGLVACAEAVQQKNLNLAKALVTQISFLAASQPGAMRKVATFFAEALAQRIFRVYPAPPIDHAYSEMLQMHFYEACPYLKFAHFTANQAILEAFQDKKRVHVIDFSMNQGMQWPALMQALALRPGGPPAFRLTGIGPPAADNSDHLQEVGWKLAQLAETIHVEFEFRGFVANSLADLDASMLDLKPGHVESVAVNSVFELHKLLARPGAIEKVLSVVKQMKPEIVTVVEQEANHNSQVFLERFNESLHYYSTLFDSLEGSTTADDKRLSEVYLGKQIFNVVACDGLDRVERHETLAQWRTRFDSSGFAPVHLGSNAFKQASMLLALFAGGDGYRVEENDGCLMLGWHTRPLIATSAWKLASGAH